MQSDPAYMDEAEDISTSPHRGLPSSPPQIASSRAAEADSSHAAFLTSQRTAPSLNTDNPYAQGEEGKTYFRRENRYFGPTSTWLSWTEQERTIALSLDRVRSQDLSLHLFNAFGLKRKAKALDRREVKRSKKGKERATSLSSRAGEEVESAGDPQSKDGRSGLAKSWTAWPMPPDQVPRQELLPQMFGDGMRRATVDLRPSADLETWLIATATRVSRERWNARDWEVEEKPISTWKRDMEVEHEDGPGTRTMSDDELSAAGDQEQISEEAANSPSTQSGDKPVFYSQPAAFFDDLSSSKIEESDSEAPETDRRPVAVADDDKARQYFLPSARHVLSKLDDLLLGLHKARYAYAAKPPGRPRGRGSQSQSQTPEQGQDRGRTTQSRSMSRRRRPRSSSAHSDISNISNISTASSRRSRRVQKLQLRDWSDVMGIASLTGWDPAVVERASERCSKLFGENMLFRTFHEGEANEGTDSHFTEQLATGRDDSADSDDDEGAHEAEEDEPLVIRSSRPCTACQAAKYPCQAATEETGLSKPCRSCVETGAFCSGIRVHSIDARVCPHRSCPRHTIPFRKQYHLQRHLDAMHGPTGRSMSRSRTSSVAPTSSEAYTSDYVSVTSFSAPFPPSSPSKQDILCPLASCRRSRQPFSKGKKLYEHIRRMHPEMDVDEVKKREAGKRAEKRGRWKDDRRRRSKSKGVSKGRRGPSQNRSRSRAVSPDETDGGREEDREEDREEGVSEDDGDEPRHVDEDVKYEA